MDKIFKKIDNKNKGIGEWLLENGWDLVFEGWEVNEVRFIF